MGVASAPAAKTKFGHMRTGPGKSGDTAALQPKFGLSTTNHKTNPAIVS